MKRFSVKQFIQGNVPFDSDALIPVFHRWIQQRLLPELLIDVADYRHVKNGPSVLLIGHEADYVFDERYGQAGLAYIYKRPSADSLPMLLHHAFERLNHAVQLLEAESSLNGVRFENTTLQLIFLDRLNAPNRPEIFETLRQDVLNTATQWFQTNKVQLDSTEADPRKCLTVQITK